MILARHSRVRLRLPRLVIRIQLPMYLWLIFGTWVCALIAVNGMLLIGAWTQALPNPLSPYSYLFRSDYDDLALGGEFACNQDVFLPEATLAERHTTAVGIEVCIYILADGPFSQVVVRDDSVSFTVRDNALVVGDLALLWGKPEICSTCSTLFRLRWPEVGLMAYARPMSGKFSYFSPVERIIVVHR